MNAPLDAAELAAGRTAWFCSQDGLRLGARIFDAPRSERLPLLCLPGLSRNSRDFLKLGQHFSMHPSEPRQVIALDYRGRGLSDRDPDWRNYTPIVEARDVLAAATAFGLEEVVVVGTSRGGIIAMLLGSLRPALLAGVVLNDIGPVIEGTGLARIKQVLMSERRFSNWDQAVRDVQAVAGHHFPGLSLADWRAHAQALFIEGPEGIVPDFDRNLTKAFGDLAFSERIPVLWPQFTALHRIPVLALRGQFSDLLSPNTLSEMAKRHPRLEQVIVPGEGHAPLLRDPASLGRIADFSRKCDGINNRESPP